MIFTKDELEEVNAHYNAMPYVAEVGDDWAPITPAGDDCDSYATAKFVALAKAGWPVLWLRLATCWVETGGYHAVLLVDLFGQTWCLDNRQPRVTEWQLLPYKFDKLQIAGTRNWEQA